MLQNPRARRAAGLCYQRYLPCAQKEQGPAHRIHPYAQKAGRRSQTNGGAAPSVTFLQGRACGLIQAEPNSGRSGPISRAHRGAIILPRFRLIRMFSFVGDVVCDPFAGTGTTTIAAIHSSRSSIANEIEPRYVRIIERHVQEDVSQLSFLRESLRVVIERPAPHATNGPAGERCSCACDRHGDKAP